MFFDSLALVTGGFDPIHSGHIKYFEDAKTFSDHLVVGLNSDQWLINKKGQYFQTWKERANIISHLDMVNIVIDWDDSDNSACKAIEKCFQLTNKIYFANGGDRAEDNTPELDAFENDERVLFIWGVGGNNKMNSSSWILDKYYQQRELICG
jgi:cytidyltransferase-like protein